MTAFLSPTPLSAQASSRSSSHLGLHTCYSFQPKGLCLTSPGELILQVSAQWSLLFEVFPGPLVWVKSPCSMFSWNLKCSPYFHTTYYIKFQFSAFLTTLMYTPQRQGLCFVHAKSLLPSVVPVVGQELKTYLSNAWVYSVLDTVLVVKGEVGRGGIRERKYEVTWEHRTLHGRAGHCGRAIGRYVILGRV